MSNVPSLRAWAHAQVPTVVKEAHGALAAGFAVVVGLQSTGEAAADALNMQPGDECGWVSTTREMLLRFVEVHFPVRREVPKAGARRARRRPALPSLTPNLACSS